MTHTRIPVSLGTRSYDVVIGDDLIDRAGELLAPMVRSDQAILVTDDNLERTAHPDRLRRALQASRIACTSIILPPGEATKCFSHFEDLIDRVLAAGIDRRTPIVALGGGVIGDLVGFAAAVTLRGIPFIQIPTTLLAQVDSSVGGKTAINSPHGKNLIGAFYQPKSVLIDLSVLDDLPEREIKAGYAEIVKYGFLHDRTFFEWLEEHGKAVIEGDRRARLHAIARSVEIKAEIVAADETEVNDQRALLNFGHTFAHAFERLAGYSDDLLHGEAVSLGMVKAFALSHRLGFCTSEDRARAQDHLQTLSMPVSVTAHLGRRLEPQRVIDAMRTDKKAISGKLRFVLARAIGETFVANGVDEGQVERVLQDDG